MSDLQERYGRTDRDRRTALIVVATTLAAIFLGFLAWVIVDQSDPAIEAELTSYEVVDANLVRIKVQARFRDDDVTGSCLFRATARDHTVVGDLNLTVAELRAAGGGWIDMKTFDRATTVERVSCTED